MRTGARNRIITIQSRTETTDDYGGTVHVWADFAKVWAGKRSLKSRDLIAAQAAQNETTAVYNIREIAGLKPSMRIVDGADYYDITGIIPIEAEHEIDIMAKTGLSEG